MINIKSVEEKDLKLLMKEVREEDAFQLLSTHNSDPYSSVKTLMKSTIDTYAIYSKEGKLLAIGGLSVPTVLSFKAYPWLIATHHIAKYPKQALTITKEYLNRWLDEWVMLQNWVDVRHKKSLKWVKKLGFKIYDPEPFGPNNYMFHRIELRRD